jgi:hypothetical protein
MGLRSSAISITGKGFDIERGVKESPITSIVLLRRDHNSATSVPWAVLKTYESGFITRYNSFRVQTEIEIATEDDLTTDVPKLMGIALMRGSRGMICMIENGDATPPDDERFTWLFFGRIKVSEIYTI